MTPEVLIANRDALGAALGATLTTEGQRAIHARGRFTVAVPGGSVARAMFPGLSRLPFDWSRTEFFWVDERAVAPSDRESNYALARLLWLNPARVPDERVHRLPAEQADLQRAALAYADDLREIAADPPRLDFVLLGVGADGHVASLFPGHPALGNERDLVAVVEDAPAPVPRRLTLTVPVLTAARLVVVVAFGSSKAGAVRDALEDPESNRPLGIVTRRARRPVFLIDSGAASQLSSTRATATPPEGR